MRARIDRAGRVRKARAQRREDALVDGGEARFVALGVGDFDANVGEAKPSRGEPIVEVEVRGQMIDERF